VRFISIVVSSSTERSLGGKTWSRNLFSLTIFRVVSPSIFLRSYLAPQLTDLLPSVDDSFLERATSSIPKQSVLLIEDIDCAFSSREDTEDEQLGMMPGYRNIVPNHYRRVQRKFAVTLSGLLNIIDGVGSEEGKLFFATYSAFSFVSDASRERIIELIDDLP
jgi:hypothetical protein